MFFTKHSVNYVVQDISAQTLLYYHLQFPRSTLGMPGSVTPLWRTSFTFFNNNAVEKCTNGKASYIVVTAQFFETFYLRCLIVFGFCLLVVVMKFYHKFASSRQVNSSNRQDNVSNMLFRHVFGTIFSEFHGILHVFFNLARFRGLT